MTPHQWEEVKERFHDALEQPAEKRHSFLMEACLDDFVRTEVARLLTEHGFAGTFLDQPAKASSSVFTVQLGAINDVFDKAKSSVLPDLRGMAGQSIGAYSLISQIGQGGMGTVWLAERADGRFERRVAIKFLHVLLAGSAAEGRFRREGTILGRLAHPHIAELLDAGVSPAGQPYLVLEYVEGEHIDRFCDQRALDIAARIRLFLDVLGSVAHAHSNLIVHRDIKSSNVLVRNDCQVKLLDFGISKLLEDADENGEASTLTAESGAALTPEYAAPEQLGDGIITTRTDIYSLGVLLYVLLTGQHPAGAGPHSLASLVRAIVDTEPARMSEIVISAAANADAAVTNAANRSATAEKLHRLLRGDLDIIITKALKKDPAERYASINAFSDDLARYLRNEPISARRDSAVYRAAKFIRRNGAPVALAALAVIAVMASVIGVIIQLGVARTQRDIAFRKIVRAQVVQSFDAFLLSDAAPLGKLSVNELLGRAEQMFGRQHEADNTDRVALMISIGSQYSLQDDETGARRVLEQAYKLSRGLSDQSTRANASCALANSLARSEELPRAETLYQEGMHELPDGVQFVFDRVDCLRSGSQVAQQRGDIREAVARTETGQQVLRNSPFDSEALELRLWADLGGVYSDAGRDADAVFAFRKAAGLLSSLGLDDTGTAESLFNDWALELAQLGQPLAAEAIYRRAIEISRDNRREDAMSPVVLTNYARALRELERLDEAADYAERAYTKARLVKHEMAINQSLFARAGIYLAMNNPDRAAAMLAELEPRLRGSLPEGHYAFASLAAGQARVSAAKGHIAEAMRLADQALLIDEAAIKSGGQDISLLPTLLMYRAAIALDAGRAGQARADAERALRELSKTLPAGTLSCVEGKAYLLLGRALRAEGKYAEARTAAAAAVKRLEPTVGPDHPDTQASRLLAAIAIPGR
jgi:serine/threonine protein kinase